MKLKLEFISGRAKYNAFLRIVKFLKYMNDTSEDSDFLKDVRSFWLTKRTTDEIRTAGQSVIVNEIYSVVSGRTDKRTGGAFRSIKTWISLDEKTLTLYSDPIESPAITGRNAYRYSRLAFFEDPDRPSFGKGSFIPVRGTLTTSRYRPFLTPLIEATKNIGTETAHKAVNSVIKLRIPRTTS